MGTSRTLIGGAAHRIIEGKTLIGGTAYSIYQGKTLIGGTAKDIILIDFINAIPAMTSNTTAKGSSVAGTCSDSASSTNAWKCFDNSNTTTNTFSVTLSKASLTTTNWSQYVTPASYALQFNALNVRVNRTSTNLSSFTWTVKISQNGSTWTSIATGTDAHNGAVSLSQTYSAKYIRLETTATYSRAGSVSINHYHLQTSMCSGCSTTCSGTCSGSCSGCGSGCAGGCSGCGSGCSTGCEGICTGCGSGCAGTCSGSCQGVCYGGCSDGCLNICDSTCALGCVSGCSYQCYGVVD